jgi:uncharacterized membrane protein YoaK (UPF0700 family)
MAFEHERDQPLAICLSALAGYVDAIGYLWLGGTFIAFMSGNSTQLGVELSGLNWLRAAIPFAIIALFVLGVVGATILRRNVRRGRPAVLALVSALLGAGGLLQSTGHTDLAITAATLAMGAENTVFEHDGEVSVGLTYMTGTLVKMSQHLATALLGGPRLDWVPNFVRWLGLVAGAIAGGVAFHLVSLNAIWLAALVAAGLTVASFIQLVDD